MKLLFTVDEADDEHHEHNEEKNESSNAYQYPYGYGIWKKIKLIETYVP